MARMPVAHASFTCVTCVSACLPHGTLPTGPSILNIAGNYGMTLAFSLCIDEFRNDMELDIHQGIGKATVYSDSLCSTHKRWVNSG
jgi:hypothetical protein